MLACDGMVDWVLSCLLSEDTHSTQGSRRIREGVISRKMVGNASLLASESIRECGDRGSLSPSV